MTRHVLDDLVLLRKGRKLYWEQLEVDKGLVFFSGCLDIYKNEKDAKQAFTDHMNSYRHQHAKDMGANLHKDTKEKGKAGA